MKLKDIKPNPNNPRVLRDDKFQKLKQSIAEFPKMLSLRPMVIDENNVVLGGNMRLRALQELGFTEIDEAWVKRSSDLTEEEKKRFIIADNVAFGEWDWDTLANDWEVVDLEAWGLEIPQFDTVEELEASEDDYEVPEGGMETDIVIGDLFEIGEHRLLCGDSTDSDAVARLMNGEKADMVFTDPPYGVSYKSNARTKTDKFEFLKNDDVFLKEWINNVTLFSNGFVFVWTSWKVLSEWIEICKPIGVLSNMIIWDKGSGSMGDLTKTFATDFEIALVYNRDNELKGKRIGSVWSVAKEMIYNYDFKVPVYDYFHPTQKPIKLAEQAIQNVSIINNLVLDFFLGSGSTMVASHQLKRKCYGMELEPKYCQVIIDRMRKLDSSLIIKRNGVELKTTK